MSIEKLKQFLFGPGSGIFQLSSAAASHQALLHRVSQALPEPIANHCIAASVNGELLTVVTDSAAWAAQLRFCEQTILSALVDDPSMKNVDRLSIHVRAGKESTAPTSSPHFNSKISNQSRKTINSCADSISDKSLSDALHHLAGRPTKKPDQSE